MTNRFHVPGMVYVSTSLKLVFIPIPKNGSTTIRRLVTANFKQVFLKKTDLTHYADYRFFTVIRDPVERFVSAYLEVRHRGYNHHLLDFIFEKDLNSSMNECLSLLETRNFDDHFLSQYELISFFDFPNLAIKYLRFDSLGNDADRYFKDLDLPLRIKGGQRLKQYAASTYKNYWHMLARFFLLIRLLFKRIFCKRLLIAAERKALFQLIRGIGARLGYIDLMPEKAACFEGVLNDEAFRERVLTLYYQDVILYESKVGR